MIGSIRKKTFTKPLPHDAEVVVVKGETFAKVKPPKGRAVIDPVTTGKDGLPKIVGTFVALSPQTRLCGCWMLRNDARGLKLSRAVNEKGSLSVADSEPFVERVKGIGPSSNAWEAEGTASQTLQMKAFRPSAEPACPTACPDVTPTLSVVGSETTSRRGGKTLARRGASEAATTAALSVSASTPMSGATPTATDFGKALAMIATLPLTDAEKAEAVRRLLGTG